MAKMRNVDLRHTDTTVFRINERFPKITIHRLHLVFPVVVVVVSKGGTDLDRISAGNRYVGRVEV